jgi:predicted LPLAT superfamily acyltransferase
MEKQSAESAPKIQAKKRGNALGFWFFKISLRLFGIGGAYNLLYPVCLHYLIFDCQARRASIAYLEKRFPECSRFSLFFKVYRLFINQGKQLIDRYAQISGHFNFDISLKGYDKLKPIMEDANLGFILLTAHVGNWQVAMTTLSKLNKFVYLLMRPEDNPAAQSSLNISRENDFIRIITPEQYLGGVVEVANVLKDGNIVSIMGDRKYGFNALEVSFLGHKARFPYGAFSIAASLGCPVVVLLSAKLADNKYAVEVARILNPKYEKNKNKQDQLKSWVAEFVATLEAYVKEYPYQCFLFHDVWAEASDQMAA